MQHLQKALSLPAIMKKTLLLNISLLLLTVTGYAQAPYQVKSAKIDFVWDNGLSKGTKTVIFDDSGRVEKIIGKELFDSTVNLGDLGFPTDFKMNKTVQNSLVIQTKDSIYSIDIDSMVGSSKPRIYLDLKSQLPEFKKVAEKKFAGKTCDVIQTPFGKMLMWKGICLNKFYGGAPIPKVYEYAIKVDENYIIKVDEFKVPPQVRME